MASDAYPFQGKIEGPRGTPYEGFVFDIRISYPTEYPFKHPKVAFLTPIYHPNVDAGTMEVHELGGRRQDEEGLAEGDFQEPPWREEIDVDPCWNKDPTGFYAVKVYNQRDGDTQMIAVNGGTTIDELKSMYEAERELEEHSLGGTSGLLVYEGSRLGGRHPLSAYEIGRGDTVYYHPAPPKSCGGILAANSSSGVHPTRWGPTLNTAHILRFLRNELLKTKATTTAATTVDEASDAVTIRVELRNVHTEESCLIDLTMNADIGDAAVAAFGGDLPLEEASVLWDGELIEGTVEENGLQDGARLVVGIDRVKPHFKRHTFCGCGRGGNPEAYRLFNEEPGRFATVARQHAMLHATSSGGGERERLLVEAALEADLARVASS